MRSLLGNDLAECEMKSSCRTNTSVARNQMCTDAAHISRMYPPSFRRVAAIARSSIGQVQLVHWCSPPARNIRHERCFSTRQTYAISGAVLSFNKPHCGFVASCTILSLSHTVCLFHTQLYTAEREWEREREREREGGEGKHFFPSSPSRAIV